MEIFNVITSCATVLVLALTAFFIYRTIYTPIDAVKVGRELDSKAQKTNAKRNLFLMLFSLRGHPAHPDFVRGLNEIDIVFQDVPKVLIAWHSYFAVLHQKDLVDKEETWKLERVNMLSRMAEHLGYGDIQQTDIMKHYYPEGLDNVYRSDWDLKDSALNFFRLGIAVFQEALDNTPSYLEKMKQPPQSHSTEKEKNTNP